MFQKTKSANKQQWKYALLIPTLIAFIALFNIKIIAQEKATWEVKVNLETVELIIEKDYSNAFLVKEAANFKTEFNIDLSFKSVKRNAANEITAIKIEAKGTDLKASFQNSGTTPIKPIKIAFDKQHNTISIGNLTESHFNYSIQDEGNISFQGNDNKNINYVFISSDGDTNTWTSKNDSIVNTEEIIIHKNGNKDRIWVAKKIDTSNTNIKVIELNSDVSGEQIIFIKEGDNTFKIDEDNASEKVYIMENKYKSGVEKTVFKTKVLSSESNDKPLIFVDGKIISSEEMDKINPNDIESINVLKGESATKKYGDKGKNGVIEITKKK